MKPSDYTSGCDRVASPGYSRGNRVFAADMQVELLNDGPVTFVLDSRNAS